MTLKKRIRKLESSLSSLLRDANRALDDMRSLHEGQEEYCLFDDDKISSVSYHKLDKTIDRVIKDYAELEQNDKGEWKVVSRIRSLSKVVANRL